MRFTYDMTEVEASYPRWGLILLGQPGGLDLRVPRWTAPGDPGIVARLQQPRIAKTLLGPLCDLDHGSCYARRGDVANQKSCSTAAFLQPRDVSAIAVECRRGVAVGVPG